MTKKLPISLATDDDRMYQEMQEWEREYQDECYHCPGNVAIAEYRANKYFKGWHIICQNCGRILAEPEVE